MDAAITAAHAAVFSDEDPATWRVAGARLSAARAAADQLRRVPSLLAQAAGWR